MNTLEYSVVSVGMFNSIDSMMLLRDSRVLKYSVVDNDKGIVVFMSPCSSEVSGVVMETNLVEVSDTVVLDRSTTVEKVKVGEIAFAKSILEF